MSYDFDSRIVLILDAGGTNFVFSAMRGEVEITKKITLPANADNLERCLQNLVSGFQQVKDALGGQEPAAISFAFPGPADYPNGIISADLPNFPAFKGPEGGFPLADYLFEQFQLPVFLNNDGDLFAYGEALFGILPEVNRKLAAAGSVKRFNNLLGVTFGTGFGAGIVINNQLVIGDNSCGAEIFPSRNLQMPDCFVEESVSIRGVKRMYAEISGQDAASLSPKDIFEIAEGRLAGDQFAAKEAWARFGTIAGDSIANIISMIDGLIVLGGGLADAHKYFLSALLQQLNGTIQKADGTTIPRIPQKVYDLDNDASFARFALGDTHELKVPGTNRSVIYDKERRIGIAISSIGANIAIMRGAYAFALDRLDEQMNLPKVGVPDWGRMED